MFHKTGWQKAKRYTKKKGWDQQTGLDYQDCSVDSGLSLCHERSHWLLSLCYSLCIIVTRLAWSRRIGIIVTDFAAPLSHCWAVSFWSPATSTFFLFAVYTLHFLVSRPPRIPAPSSWPSSGHCTPTREGVFVEVGGVLESSLVCVYRLLGHNRILRNVK